jgi:Methyltransferase domain
VRPRRCYGASRADVVHQKLFLWSGSTPSARHSGSSAWNALAYVADGDQLWLVMRNGIAAHYTAHRIRAQASPAAWSSAASSKSSIRSIEMRRQASVNGGPWRDTTHNDVLQYPISTPQSRSEGKPTWRRAGQSADPDPKLLSANDLRRGGTNTGFCYIAWRLPVLTELCRASQETCHQSKPRGPTNNSSALVREHAQSDPGRSTWPMVGCPARYTWPSGHDFLRSKLCSTAPHRRIGNSGWCLDSSVAAAEATKAHVLFVDIEGCGTIDFPPHLQKRWTFIQADDVNFSMQPFEAFCSARGWPAQAEVILIDTSHEYEHTRAELECWIPRLATLGVMLFHDTNMGNGWYRGLNGKAEPGGNRTRGVIQALEEFFGRRYDETTYFSDATGPFALSHVPWSSGLTVVRKLAPL